MQPERGCVESRPAFIGPPPRPLHCPPFWNYRRPFLLKSLSAHSLFMRRECTRETDREDGNGRSQPGQRRRSPTPPHQTLLIKEIHHAEMDAVASWCRFFIYVWTCTDFETGKRHLGWDFAFPVSCLCDSAFCTRKCDDMSIFRNLMTWRGGGRHKQSI